LTSPIPTCENSPQLAAEPRYEPEAIRDLFDEMAATYGAVNVISSFGFAVRWRHQAIARLPHKASLRRVADLMSGKGELWRSLARRLDGGSEVVAVEISREMMRRSPRRQPFAVTIRTEDVLTCELEPASFDAVVSSFGLKTLSPAQQRELALRVAHLLRPGGVFSFIEISVPSSGLLRALYMFYMKRVIPWIGRMLLGNPANYRMLGIYTEAFGDCRHFMRCLDEAGLGARFASYFFGCASGVVGSKPG
jgi:demethylmenaquinone methyltransferase/2-methoxy-6-polyprenyl-1,4-benzoquinol methylase